MVGDFADGFAARMLNSYSEIGKQLDSLADAISFTVAPAFLLYQVLTQIDDLPAIITFAPALIVASGVYRLARFNTEESKNYFSGLPTPANAFFFSALAMAIQASNIQMNLDGIIAQIALVAIIILHSALVLSYFPILSLKGTNQSIRIMLGVFIAISAALIFSLNYLGLAISIWIYIVLSLSFKKIVTSAN